MALKHADELGVDISTGDVVTGEAHAPLLYHSDPRSDEPESLCAIIERQAAGWDAIVVRAWLDARCQGQIGPDAWTCDCRRASNSPAPPIELINSLSDL